MKGSTEQERGTNNAGIQKRGQWNMVSVLGLIFEKINGYKEGSFYTKSFVTEYICQETIENTVIEKLNKEFISNRE